MSLETETIQISGLPPGTKEALERIGRSSGQSVEEYLRGVIEAEILADRPFSEILEPIRRSFDESGMSEEELETLFEAAREKVYQESQEQNQ